MSWLFGGGSDSSSSDTSSKSDFSSSDSSFSNFDSGSIGDKSQDGGDLQNFLALEQQRATFQASVHKMNDICWETCMTSGYDSSRMGSRSETCISNCVERFIDSSLFITNRFAQLLSKQHGGGLG